MYCISCGTNNTETTRFCTRCGSNLEDLRQALTMPLESAPAVEKLSFNQIMALAVVGGIVTLASLAIVFAIIGTRIFNQPGVMDSPLPVMLVLGGFSIIFFYLWTFTKLASGGVKPPRVEAPRAARASKRMAHAGQQALPSPIRDERIADVMPMTPPSVVEHTTARLQKYAPPEPE